MDDNVKNFDLALAKPKSQDETSRRQTIMRQLLGELLVINDALDKEKTHPFSSLEVIIEEVTPCSSSQQLEDNLSAIKAELTTQPQDSEIDSSEEYDTDGEFVQNKNSLRDMYNTNIYFIKQRAQMMNSEEYNSDVSTTSTRIGSTFNGSNTSNIDSPFYNVSESRASSCNPRNRIECKYDSTSEDDSNRTINTSFYGKTNNNNNKDEIFRLYDNFINEDDRYTKKENPRTKFLTLNRNYERSNYKLERNRQCSSSTSNLDNLTKINSTSTCSWAIKAPKKPEKNKQTKTTSTNKKKIEFFKKNSQKENKSPCSWAVKTPKQKSDKAYCGEVNFACINTYAVKTSPSNNKPKLDYNKCTTEQLEERLKYYEDQVQTIQDVYIDNLQSSELTYQQENEVSSSEDDAQKCRAWRAELTNSFNLDRGDYKSMDNCSNSIDDMPVNMGHIESSPNDSIESFNDNKSSGNDSENNPTYSGTIIVVKKSSKDTCDSGMCTRSSRNPNIQEIDENETAPQIMNPNIMKSVSTQITDDDWNKICISKQEMAERGSLKLNLPNSSDDETLDESKKSKTKVLFQSQTMVINDSSSDSTLYNTPIFTPLDTCREETSGCNCSCFNHLKKFFFKK